MNTNYVDLSLAPALELVKDCWDSDPNIAPFLIAPPGIGKTEGTGDLARATGRVPIFFEAAHSADEDMAGIPVRNTVTGAVERLPLGPFRTASEQAAGLVLDEVSRAGGQKQGCLLTIANEGRAGDFRLHKDTRIVLCANGTDSAGAHSIIDALLNRCLVINVHADVKEVRDYLTTRVGTPGSSLRELALDFAATSDKAAGLIQCEPPEGYAESGAPWASPRAIVKALKVFDSSLKAGRTGDVLFASLAGLIGKEAAGSYLAIRKVRSRLPSVEEIVGAPKTCKVPGKEDLEANVGTLGLVTIAASRNPDSAWLYAGRLESRECSAALTRALTRFPPVGADAVKVKFTLLGRTGTAQAQ